jgi:hypothetical protein
VAAQQAPDPRQMSGMPLPVNDVPTGTVTVRVIRGTFANPVSSQTVELVGGGIRMTATTNEIGRAEFSGVASAIRVKATANVAGERLESQEFAVPSEGGIRLILVAADTAVGSVSQPASVPVQPGSVVLGDESRFVFEIGEEGLSVFYILQIQNPSSAPVQPERPVVFELPSEARGATILQGSSPQAKVIGHRFQVDGPFAPGPTLVQLAYTLPLSRAQLVVEQPLPLTLTHLAVVAQKVGDMQLASPQMAEQRTMPAQGNEYIAGRGGPVKAGDVLRFSFSGLPHQSTWPRTLAMALAVVILAAGAWSSMRVNGRGGTQDIERRELEMKRDQLFGELTALEARRREQAVDPQLYAERRRELVSALERVYIALDDEAAVSRAS